MKSHFKNYNLRKCLASLARRLELEVKEDCQKRWLLLDEAGGSGTLAAYDFEDGLQMLVLDGALPEDWEIASQSGTESPFLLYFCVRGEVIFDYDGTEEKPMPITPLNALMVAHPASQQQVISLRQGVKTTFVWLQLERHLYINHIKCLPDPVLEQVGNIFNGKTATKQFVNSEYGLKSAALVQQVLDDNKDGLIHATFSESKAIELFSMQLRRWEAEIMTTPAKAKGQLRPEDYEKIIMARNLLVADLINAPTIEVLSRKSGVNRQKLKQGFKKLFGTTINDYLRNERLRLAKQLLGSGNSVVREVAANVGYENPSYFARRFKEKYGVYPNEYLRTVQAIGEEE